MSQIETQNKRAKGNFGEKLAQTFLEQKGFEIVDRNYQKKWGELDIVAVKDNIVNFFEVKSVMVAVDNQMSDIHRPEDNVDGWKVKHLKRIIETYLEESQRGVDAEFRFHVLCVYMNTKTRRATIKWLEDIIL